MVQGLECNEVTYAPTGAYLAGTNTPASGISRRKVTGSVTFNDVQARWEAPWNATIAVGANNVFAKYGRSLAKHRDLRRAALIFTLVAFLTTGVAGGFGAFLNKYAPIRGGATIQLMHGE